MTSAYLAGLILGLALITPIGAQNVFVLSQGFAAGWPRALWSVAAAGLCDTILILAGAGGASALITGVPDIRNTLLLIGAAFLAFLGSQYLRSAGERLDETKTQSQEQPLPPLHVIGRTASVSLLNPHAILDTVGVIGTAVAAQSSASRIAFAAGTVSASWLWFTLLALAAAKLRRFLTPRRSRWFDRASAGVMFVFAGLFLVEFLRTLAR